MSLQIQTKRENDSVQSQEINYKDLLQNALLEIRKMRLEVDNFKSRQNEPIAVIGMGCRLPQNVNTPEDYWQILSNGVNVITEIPTQRWDIDAYYDPDPDVPGKMYTRYGGFLDNIYDFDPNFFGISPKEASAIDPQQRLLLEIAWQALENAGQPLDKIKGSLTGVFIGITTDDYSHLSINQNERYNLNIYRALGTLRCMAAGRISYLLNFHGPSMQVDTACSSSLLSVHLAIQSLRSRECNLALAGGINLMLSPEVTISLCKMRALTSDKFCKTFDQQADGYVRGEGGGIVVLKRLSDAIEDQDNILATLRGSAINHDGFSNGITAPNGLAQELVIQKALDNANLSGEQIQYVEAHGTGTSLGDPIEVQALANVLRKNGQIKTPLAIGSVKTNLGHLEAAAGIASLIKVVISLQHKQIPPHLHLKQLNSYIPWHKLPVMIPTKLTPWGTQDGNRLAGVSSFGMSGTNVHIILEEGEN